MMDKRPGQSLPLFGAARDADTAAISVAEAAARCGLSVRAIHRAIQSGTLPAYETPCRQGREYRIRPDDLDRLAITHAGAMISLSQARGSTDVGAAARSAMLLIATAYLAAIALVEIIIARGGIVPGIACDALLIVLLLGHVSWPGATPRRDILAALALLPLLRILSVTMPFPAAPRIYWYALTGLPLLIASIGMARALGVTWASLGLRASRWRDQVAVALTGLPLSLAGYILMRPPSVIARPDGQHLAAAALILIVSVGLTEELLFRGLLQHLASSLSGTFGLLFAAAAFAAMYAGSLSVAYAGFMGLVGLLFGWCVRRTGSIWGVVFAHGGLIIGMLCIWPFIRP